MAAAAVISATAFGQNSFEIADVHVSPHSANPAMRGFMRGGRYELRTATMVDLIRTAFGVDEANVMGGPSWLESDRFDLIAKAPPDSSPEALRLMLQSLLADRFKLVVHNEDKSLSAYVLTSLRVDPAKRNPQMKESDGAAGSGCQGQPTDSPVVNQSYFCHNMTMEAFAESLRNLARGYIGSNLIQDKTGLKGAWDFNIKWSGRNVLAAGSSGAISLFDAVEKQLGLKLELKNIPIPVIVVDSVNRQPTENPPGVTQKLPVIPSAFEVSDIKPSPPGTQENFQIQPGGRIDGRAITLKDLVKFAWNIDDDDDDRLAGPKWLETERFDIVAKAPAEAGQLPDDETLQSMARTMLVDRFRLTTHYEDRPVTVWALVAVKPKLRVADAANRSSCKVAGVGNGSAAAALLRTFTCQNVTMSLFADKLHDIAPAYIDHPVVDATGMDGAWDFTFGFSGRRLYEGSVGRGVQTPGGPAPGAAASASDPNGAVSLFEALEKLGLKLEVQKHPMPVLVIDHIEQKPTDN
jgi:uncharacterized protein (TIGR03435 family)